MSYTGAQNTDLTRFLLARTEAVLRETPGHRGAAAARNVVLAYQGLWQTTREAARAGGPDVQTGRNMYAALHEIALPLLAQVYRDHPDFQEEWE